LLLLQWFLRDLGVKQQQTSESPCCESSSIFNHSDLLK